MKIVAPKPRVYAEGIVLKKAEKGGGGMNAKYSAGDLLTVQVRVKEVIETTKGIEYAIVDKGEEILISLRIPEKDVLNCVEE